MLIRLPSPNEGCPRPRRWMRDPIEVLHRKEAELQRLREEVLALRLVCSFVNEQKQTGGSTGTLVQMPQIHLA